MTAWDYFLYGITILCLLPFAALFISLCVTLLDYIIERCKKSRLPAWPVSMNRQPAGHTAERVSLQQAS